jgi:hypothetical protein
MKLKTLSVYLLLIATTLGANLKTVTTSRTIHSNPIIVPITVVGVKITNPCTEIAISQSYTPNIEVDYSNGTVVYNPSDLTITQSPYLLTQSGSTFIGAHSGNTTLTITEGKVSVSETIYVNPIESVPLASLDSFLTTPAKNARIIVPIVVVNYYPTVDGINLDTTRAPVQGNAYGSMTLTQVKLRTSDNQKLTKYGIEEGSKFRNYNGTNVDAEVGLKVVGWFNVYEASTMMVPNQPVTATTDPILDVRPIFLNINLKDFVNNLGVKEVWLNLYPISSEYSLVSLYKIPQSSWINFAESYMSSPTTGNISNSDRSNDVLPVYNSTYVVYGYNLGRTYSDNMHNRGHQIECEMSYIDTSGSLQNGKYLFWNQFVGIPYPAGGLPTGRVGDTHFAPNSTIDYDWQDVNPIVSDIRNWVPDGGKQEMVNCSMWMNITYNLPSQSTYDNSYIEGDAQFKWLMFLYQSIPGYNNNIPFRNTTLTDWWNIFYNWDAANLQNKNLWQ